MGLKLVKQDLCERESKSYQTMVLRLNAFVEGMRFLKVLYLISFSVKHFFEILHYFISFIYLFILLYLTFTLFFIIYLFILLKVFILFICLFLIRFYFA